MWVALLLVLVLLMLLGLQNLRGLGALHPTLAGQAQPSLALGSGPSGCPKPLYQEHCWQLRVWEKQTGPQESWQVCLGFYGAALHQDWTTVEVMRVPWQRAGAAGGQKGLAALASMTLLDAVGEPEPACPALIYACKPTKQMQHLDDPGWLD